MGKKEKGMIETLGAVIESISGKKARDEIMEGSAKAAASSRPEVLAVWLKEAMERMDRLIPTKKRTQVRAACGKACAGENRGMIARAEAKLAKFKDLDAFVAAEKAKPSKTTRLDKKGNVLYWTFTPRAFLRGGRCFCGFMKGLPERVTVSPTYCGCSCGFVEVYWSRVLKKPVQVKLLESCLSGGRECRFAIRIQP